MIVAEKEDLNCWYDNNIYLNSVSFEDSSKL